MPIKRSNAISKTDFEDALDYLGASISQVAEESRIPRAYLSNLKNRNIRLQREYEEKLRAYLQEKEVEFESDEDPPRPTTSTTSTSLKSATVERFHLPISDEHSAEVVEEAMALLDASEARLTVLLMEPAPKVESMLLFMKPEFSEKTMAEIEEAKKLCIECYLLVRKLRGSRVLRMAVVEEGNETIGDWIVEENLPLFMEAGFFKPDTQEADPEEDKKAA